MKKLVSFTLVIFLFTCFSCGLIADTIRGDNPIRLGMTDDAVIEAWGRPARISRSVGSWGVREQWRYGMYGIATGASNFQYLYFQNGILTSWQN